MTQREAVTSENLGEDRGWVDGGKDLKLRRKSTKAGVDGQHGGQKIPTSEIFET